MCSAHPFYSVLLIACFLTFRSYGESSYYFLSIEHLVFCLSSSLFSRFIYFFFTVSFNVWILACSVTQLLFSISALYIVFMTSNLTEFLRKNRIGKTHRQPLFLFYQHSLSSVSCCWRWPLVSLFLLQYSLCSIEVKLSVEPQLRIVCKPFRRMHENYTYRREVIIASVLWLLGKSDQLNPTCFCVLCPSDLLFIWALHINNVLSINKSTSTLAIVVVFCLAQCSNESPYWLVHE